ncbi:MAG: sugar ABC transporter permease, partial [Caldilineaceae bacterium]|nr:sugar ABC transporter permease [Caldilineaceae bacterium]
PFALIFIVITLLPIFFGIYISFNEWGIVGDPEWVGLDNFREAMQDDWIPKVWGNTFQMAALVVPGTVIVALLMALWINREQWLSGPIRTAFFAPHVVAITVTAIIWIWIFEKETGLLNLALYGIGIPKQGWLTTSKWVIQSISLVTIWQAVGFHMVILLAGLKEIPAELGEAAVIDGASAWQAFWRITLPLLIPALGLVITLEIISAFRIFGQVYLMTGGGPGGHSATIVSYIYHEGFVRFRLGFAAALSLLLFLTILIFTLLRARLVREHSN